MNSSPPRTRAQLFAAIAAAGLTHSAHAQWAPPYWGIERIGLYAGAEFTRQDGYQLSYDRGQNRAGRIIGTSQRFGSGTTSLGGAAWTWSAGGGTVRLGYFEGPGFTSSTGVQQSSSFSITPAGLVAGYSDMFAGGATSIGNAAWAWSPSAGTTRIGLFTDPEFTGDGGRQFSTIANTTAIGRINGFSERYNGLFSLGRGTWTWDVAGGNVRTGFFGPEYTQTGGSQYSWINVANDSGQSIGTSQRFEGVASRGESTWAWTPGLGTVRTGLFGPEFTSPTGFQNSINFGLSASGRAAGRSDRVNAPTGSRATWTWDAQNGTVRTGLYSDFEYTASDGFQLSTLVEMTDTGHMTGHSRRFLDGAWAGDAAWVWTEGTGTVRMGFNDGPEFTRPDGWQWSTIGRINNAGRVTGESTRFDGLSSRGSASWTWDAAGGTVRIGLVAGTEFTSASGTQGSYSEAINLSGRIMGRSTRYSGELPAGSASWTWDEAGVTVRTGLFTGPEFTRSDGYQTGECDRLTEAGRITGWSERFGGGPAARGRATWTWTSETGTVRTGLYDAIHTTGDGTIANRNLVVSESGFIVGIAQRSGGGVLGSLGHSAWFFDPVSLLTTELVFSTAANGRAITSPRHLTESGWVVGMYDVFDADAFVSTNAFIWSLDRGFADLGSVVEGGLSGSGIARLSSLLGVDEANQLLYRGLPIGLSPNSQGLFVFTIPAPGAATLALAGLLSAARRRRHAPVSASSANVASQCSPA